MDSDQLARKLNDLMVDMIKTKGNLRDPSVEGALRSVLRHRLLPENIDFGQAYTDTAVVLKRSRRPGIVPMGQPVVSSTMPSLVAGILEAAELAKGQRVLHIGTGPGYLDALAAELVSANGTVVTVEINKATAIDTARRLRQLGVINIESVIGDGVLGHSDSAPYDRVIATASCSDVPQAWIDQLVDNGLIVLPLPFSSKSSLYPIIAFRKEGDHLRGTIPPALSIVSFLPLYGNSVDRPRRYDPRIQKLERNIASQLSFGATDTHRSRAAQLIAMLFLAQAIEKEHRAISELRAQDILASTMSFLKNRRPPSLEDFAFYLSSAGQRPPDYEWSFENGNHRLSVVFEGQSRVDGA